MSLGLDTSVLVRLLIGAPPNLTAKAQARLLEAHRVRQSVTVSDLVIAEAYHALRHHYGLDPADIRRGLLAMLTSGMVQPESGSAVLAVLQAKIPGKAGFVDRLIQARYETDGLTTLTLDKAQSKIGKTEFIG
jgi:predicted nucleic-acid-binding protein